MKARFNPVSLINLVEPIGWVVDALTGAIAKFDNTVHVELAAKDAGATTVSTPSRSTLVPASAAPSTASVHRAGAQARRR